MGYSTSFDGELYFTTALTADASAYLSTFLGQDVRDHPDWEGRYPDSFFHINLEIAPDRCGIVWDGSEKTYGMEDAVAFIITMMRERFPYFGLFGYFLAQGEDPEDRWYMVVNGDSVLRHEMLDPNTKRKYRKKPIAETSDYESYEII